MPLDSTPTWSTMTQAKRRLALIDALENLPSGWNWDFWEPDCCAIGLMRNHFGATSRPLGGVMEDLGFTKGQVLAIFYGSYCADPGFFRPYVDLAVITSEAVAEAIRNPPEC